MTGLLGFLAVMLVVAALALAPLVFVIWATRTRQDRAAVPCAPGPCASAAARLAR